MNKGIRQACNVKFMQMLVTRNEGSNKQFRNDILTYLQEEFECTRGAAATHYNHSFKEVKQNNPQLVLNLGRAPGTNNGGPKRKVAAIVVAKVDVYRKKDGKLVYCQITAEAAHAAIAKAVTGKKATLIIA